VSRYGTARYGQEQHPGSLVRRESTEDLYALSREIEQEQNPDEPASTQDNGQELTEDDGWTVLN
jgi:hypothetical protein